MVSLKNIAKFVINLDKQTDRLKMFDAEFHNFFGPDQVYTRVPAESGSIARRAIATSHKKAVHLAKEMELDEVCIMEDDVRFTSQRAYRYAQRCFEKVPEDWDVLLGGTYSAHVIRKQNDWLKLSDFSTIHFYVINKKSYDAILGMNTDQHIDRWIASSGLNCYRTKKIFAVQRSGYSSNAKKIVCYDSMLDKRDLV